MKLLITLTLSVLLMGNAFAQSIKGQPAVSADRAAHTTERMTKQLALTPEQTKQVSVMNVKYAQQADELQQVDKEHKAEMKEKLQGSMEAELKAILTPEQYGKWRELQEYSKSHTEDGRLIQSVGSTQ